MHITAFFVGELGRSDEDPAPTVHLRRPFWSWAGGPLRAVAESSGWHSDAESAMNTTGEADGFHWLSLEEGLCAQQTNVLPHPSSDLQKCKGKEEVGKLRFLNRRNAACLPAFKNLGPRFVPAAVRSSWWFRAPPLEWLAAETPCCR